MESQAGTILAATILLCILSVSVHAQTSRCYYDSSPCEAYAGADAVFVARVTKILPETIQIWQRDGDYDQIANVVIEKAYKGVKVNRLALHQLGRRNAPKFILGSRYLFYANFDRVIRKWEVKPCGRTRMVKYVQDDLHYIEGLPASANKTRIAGEVVRYETDQENPQGWSRRLPGIRIRIIGDKKEYEVFTDADGIYEVHGLPSGRYLVKPEIPFGLTLLAVMHYGPLDLSRLRSLEVELKESGCSGATILLTPNRTIEKEKIGH